MGSAGLISQTLLLPELGSGPHRQRPVGQAFTSQTHGVDIPALQLAQALIEMERALGEAALAIAFLQEGAIAKFGVVAGEGEVAKAV